jgi:hypothetical protein
MRPPCQHPGDQQAGEEQAPCALAAERYDRDVVSIVQSSWSALPRRNAWRTTIAKTAVTAADTPMSIAMSLMTSLTNTPVLRESRKIFQRGDPGFLPQIEHHVSNG